MTTEHFISVIIPNYNGACTIGTCIEAVLASRYPRFEVIVVDDGSSDGSVDIIRRFPCRLVLRTAHGGAAAARNEGARASAGKYLFFIDADCVLPEDTLGRVNVALAGNENAVVGGTYTLRPHDSGFFSAFQSAFIHHSETHRTPPDYVATHALAIPAGLFRKSGGFSETFLPILEDVEFSHRLRKKGVPLIMNSGIQVRHIFNFTLTRSLRNAFRKARYWTVYSLGAGDFLADSGTASRELKMNGVSFLLSSVLAFTALVSGNANFLLPLPVLLIINLWTSRGLLAAFAAAGGLSFAALAALYYLTLYPAAVLTGSCAGLFSSITSSFRCRRAQA